MLTVIVPHIIHLCLDPRCGDICVFLVYFCINGNSVYFGLFEVFLVYFGSKSLCQSRYVLSTASRLCVRAFLLRFYHIFSLPREIFPGIFLLFLSRNITIPPHYLSSIPTSLVLLVVSCASNV